MGLKLVPAVSRRYLQQRLEGKETLSNSRELFDYLNLTIRDKKRECFVAVYLDAKNRVIAAETLFTGTLRQRRLSP